MVCQSYKKNGMLDSTCKNCKKKEGCPGWVKKNPHALVDVCCSDDTPDMAKVADLISSGIDLQYTVSTLGGADKRVCGEIVVGL